MEPEAVEGFLTYGAGLTCTIEAELEDACGGGGTGGAACNGCVIDGIQCGCANVDRFALTNSSVMPSIHL